MARKTKELSSEILQLVADYKQETSVNRRIGDWDAKNAADEKAFAECMNKYSLRYSARAIATLTQLKKMGLPVSQMLEYTAERPTNPIGVEEIGRELGVFAETLSAH